MSGERTVWYAVADLKSPTAEPFMIVSVDTAVKSGDGAEGTVVSLHWNRDEAQRIVDQFNRAPCEYCGDGKSTGLPGNACENCMNTGLKYPTAKDLT